MTANDNVSTQAPAKEPRERWVRGVLLAAGILVGLAVVGFIASRVGLDRQTVERHLRAAEQQLDTLAADSGYRVILEYKGLAFGGGFFSRRVVLVEPSLKVQPVSAQAGQEGFTLTAAQVDLMPDGADFSEVTLVFPSAVNIITSRQIYAVSAATPAELAVAVKKKNGKREVSYILPLVREWTVKPREHAALIIAGGKGSQISGIFDADGDEHLAEILLLHTTLRQDERAATIGQLHGVMEAARNENSLLRHYEANGEGIIFTGALAALGTLEGVLDMEMETVLADDSSAPDTAFGRMVTVNKLHLESSDYALHARASWQFDTGQLMPFGSALVTLVRPVALVRALKNSTLLGDLSASMLWLGLEKAAGQALEDSEKIVLRLGRNPGGAFQVGSTTFEELVAAMVQGLLRGLPPVDAPEEAELEEEPAEATEPVGDDVDFGETTPLVPRSSETNVMPPPAHEEAN